MYTGYSFSGDSLPLHLFNIFNIYIRQVDMSDKHRIVLFNKVSLVPIGIFTQ